MAEVKHSNPYKGLEPFTEEDALYFFGRDREKEMIIANLLASRLTLLYGESGVGKSSVLRAGVAHDMKEAATRNLKKYNSPEFITIVFSSWSTDPIAAFQKEIEEVIQKTFGTKRSFKNVSRSLSLTEYLREWTKQTGCDLLIIFDQFEEYFFYHAKGSSIADQIVQDHFDSSIKDLDSEEKKELAFQIFQHLITPSRTKIAQTIPDLAEYAQSSVDKVKDLLEQFAKGDR